MQIFFYFRKHSIAAHKNCTEYIFCGTMDIADIFRRL